MQDFSHQQSQFSQKSEGIWNFATSISNPGTRHLLSFWGGQKSSLRLFSWLLKGLLNLTLFGQRNKPICWRFSFKKITNQPPISWRISLTIVQNSGGWFQEIDHFTNKIQWTQTSNRLPTKSRWKSFPNATAGNLGLKLPPLNIISKRKRQICSLEVILNSTASQEVFHLLNVIYPSSAPSLHWSLRSTHLGWFANPDVFKIKSSGMFR